MQYLVQVNMSFDDGLKETLINPLEIEFMTRNPRVNSTVLYFKSGKIKGVQESADQIAKACSLKIVIAGAAQESAEEREVNKVLEEQISPTVKQPSAVYGNKGDQATPVKKKKVIDSKAPAAVITGGRKKVGGRKNDGITRRPRGEAASKMVGTGVEATMTMAEPSTAL